MYASPIKWPGRGRENHFIGLAYSGEILLQKKALIHPHAARGRATGFDVRQHRLTRPLLHPWRMLLGLFGTRLGLFYMYVLYPAILSG